MEGETTAQYKPRLPPLKLFINGQFVDSTTKKTFPVVQPASEEVIAHVPEAGKEDVDAAVNAAHAALKGEWGRLGPEGRRDILLKLATVLERDADDLSKLESYCNGGPLAFQTAVVKGLASDVRYYAGWCEKVDGRTPRCPPDVFAYTRREPIGVCALILPWNVPLWALMVKLAPCLSQGNTVVVKPAEQTPLTTLRVAELFNEVGFPPGVLNIVTGYGQTGEFVSRHMNIQKVAFTGSTEVGRKIMKAAAESNLKKVQLELGGKSPLVILPDADLELATTIARTGVFFNNGQLCTSASRTFVHASIYDKFVEKAVLKAKEIQVGDQFVATQGPQVDRPQFEKVLDYIEKGKKEGAKLECGGSRVGAKGYFVAPTVFSNVTDDMIIAREEIFGPVQSIIKFNDINEVVERCNSTEYGLAAGIVSNDLNAVINLSNKIKAGTVWVNTYHVVFPYLEFGGFKQSGFGREGGVEGISEWTQTKTVIMNVPARM